MKNILLKYLLVIIVIANSVFAQSSFKTQLDYANNLFEEGLYFDAITEYKRLQYFDSSSVYSFETNFNIGNSYKKGAKFEEAIFYYSKAFLESKSDSQRYQTKLETIKVNILRKSFARANQLIEEVRIGYNFRDKNKELDYWTGWNYMLADKWDTAAVYFDKIDNNHELKKLALQVENDKYSVTFAKVISYILPGSGQVYSGNYLSGLMSLSWNVLWGVLTVNAFSADRIFDGVVIADLLWLRFYRGNTENAEKFVLEKNIDISNQALRYLQNNYKGKKP